MVLKGEVRLLAAAEEGRRRGCVCVCVCVSERFTLDKLLFL